MLGDKTRLPTNTAPLVPFNRPSLRGREIEYIQDAMRSGRFAGDGHYTHLCNVLLEKILGVTRVLLTTSCTHALEMAAILLDIKPGDEVVIPAFTFVSTANAFVLRGAKPIFADIRTDTLNINEEMLPSYLSEYTRAIIPVHYAGISCAMETIMAVARDSGASIIEDNAHGLFGLYKGRKLGTFGALSTLSFHETKNVFCGEGGAIVINDQSLVERAEIVREKGTNRRQFLQGQVDRYTWVDVGSSFLPSDLLAAFLLAQLESREVIQERRLQIWQRYNAELSRWAETKGIQLPTVPEGCVHPAHLYYLLLPSRSERSALMQHLECFGVQSAFHYQPLHLSEMGRRFGGRPGDCPVAERVSECLLRLPCFPALTEAEQGRVIEVLLGS